MKKIALIGVFLLMGQSIYCQLSITAKYRTDYGMIGIIDSVKFPEIKTLTPVAKGKFAESLKLFYSITLKDNYSSIEFVDKHKGGRVFELMSIDKKEVIEFITPNDSLYIYQANFQDDSPIKLSNWFLDTRYDWLFLNPVVYHPEDSNEVIGQGIDIEKAWDITTGDSNLILGIMEHGLDWDDHPDLPSPVWNWDYFWDKDTVYYHYHGMSIGGVICATTNNITGIAGIAGGWYPKKGCSYASFSATGGFGVVGIIAAFEDAAEMNIPTMNCSFGLPYYDDRVESQLFMAAIGEFVANKGMYLRKGSIIFASAGNYMTKIDTFQSTNDTITTCLPQIAAFLYDEVMAIGNCDTDDTLSPYSVRGNVLDCVAPSRTVPHLDADPHGNHTGEVKLYKVRDIATSGASPVVHGIAALVMSKYPEYFTAAEVVNIINNSADNIEESQADSNKTAVGAGRVNAHKALLEAERYIKHNKIMFY